MCDLWSSDSAAELEGFVLKAGKSIYQGQCLMLLSAYYKLQIRNSQDFYF